MRAHALAIDPRQGAPRPGRAAPVDRGGRAMTAPAAPVPNPGAARAEQERHLLRQVRGVVGLVLVLSAALAGLSLFPDAQHERIDRTAPPTPIQGGPGAPAPDVARSDGGTPATTTATPAAAGSAPGADPAPTTTAAGPSPGTTTGTTTATTTTAAPPPATPTPAAAPTTTPAPAAPVATPPPAPNVPAKGSELPPGPRHYVTLGTFVVPADAEALRARLDAQGLPAVLEARLRVGPFATREEAVAAQARLKDLGFAPGAVLSPKR